MDMSEWRKLPRLYVDREPSPGQTLMLSPDQGHYLRNVLRRQEGDPVRVFDGRSGEWLARIRRAGKKETALSCETRIRPQGPPAPPACLYFAPIRKARMDMLVEKAVELGATRLHPVLTERTETRTLNAERMRAQIVEAAEQCERMDVPALAPLTHLREALAGADMVAACLERIDAPPLARVIHERGARAFLIGPEGGFTPAESAWLLSRPFIVPASLGSAVLRSETAACAALVLASAAADSP